MRRKNLKLAIVAAGIKYQTLAIKANRILGKKNRLSELNITQIVTCRKKPTAEQASAIASVLGRSPADLFRSEAAA